MQGKEMSKDENVLMAQVQAQLQNMQQQAQAAQQIQVCLMDAANLMYKQGLNN